MIKLKELTEWLGVTLFELHLFCVAILIYSVMLTLKIEGFLDVSWKIVHGPLFVCDASLAYFCVIVFIRQYIEGLYRVALLRAFWSSYQLLSLLFIKLILCSKLEGESQVTGSSEVMTPIYCHLCLLLLRGCRVL